jgi:phenylacetic acid degradation operon negative regulatory protein
MKSMLDDRSARGVPVFVVVMTLFGLYVLEFGRGEVVPTKTFLRATEPLGISPPALRTMLRRSCEKGLLREHKAGREVHYALTEAGLTLAQQGRRRMYDPEALVHAAGEWTLLTLPEGPALRNDRYQLKIRLAWAGFASLMPNVWVTPGRVDVQALLNQAFDGDPPVEAMPFLATPMVPAQARRMIERVWDLPAIGQQHQRFLTQWEQPSLDAAHPLADLLRLINDWSDLLLVDPGLPASDLPPAWPAPRSVAAFARAKAQLWEPARAQLVDLSSVVPLGLNM